MFSTFTVAITTSNNNHELKKIKVWQWGEIIHCNIFTVYLRLLQVCDCISQQFFFPSDCNVFKTILHLTSVVSLDIHSLTILSNFVSSDKETSLFKVPR